MKRVKDLESFGVSVRLGYKETHSMQRKHKKTENGKKECREAAIKERLKT